jgi:mRNA interferase MazF
MNRGEIWTVAGGGDFAGKPRPAVIIHDDHFDGTNSVTICPITTDQTDLSLFRVPVDPNPTSGLAQPSRIMADKITTVWRSRMVGPVGMLDDEQVAKLNRAVAVFLGLAG